MSFWGYTQEEAIKNIQAAVEAYIEDLKKHHEPIPQEPKEMVTVFSEPLVTANVWSAKDLRRLKLIK